MSSASARNPQSLNLYAYVENNPIDFVDLTELCTFRINITETTPLDETAVTYAENEIKRIFTQVGHDVVFEGKADAAYNITVGALMKQV